MKRIFTLLIVICTFSSVRADIIRHTYNMADPQVKTTAGYTTLQFEGTLLSGKAGEPALPWHAVKLLLPPGHEAVSITVEGSDHVTLNGYYKLYPMQHSRPLSDKSPRPDEVFINASVYSSETDYPKSLTGNLSTHFMNGYGYALATFTPVSYNPAKGTVKYYTTVTITIETRETQRALNALSNLTSASQTTVRAKNFAQNPQQMSLYPEKSRSVESYDILIVTGADFLTAMEPLKAFYLKQGLKTDIVSMQYINFNAPGTDNADRLRNYIIQEYQNKGISHVILGGDVQHVPYRGFFCHVQSSSVYEDNDIPSDLYFSALDGNWNTNSNNLYGEIGEDDLLPDISVGRMSFSNTTELSAMLNKTMKYQSQPIQGELNNHLLAGENLYDNPETWGSDYLELLVGTHDNNGYTTTGIPASYPIQRMYDETSNWWPEDLMDVINTGKSFINHVGHANENYTMKLYNSDITNANFSGVDGVTHNFPIVYTHGCICGAFDASDCIAERMVAIENFAAAFIGNSRYGWFNEGQTEGPSAHLNREFIDALYADSLNRIGRAHMESKIETSIWVNAPGQWEEGALRWCFYDCNVLGDPAMAVWTNEPIPVSVVFPATVGGNETGFDVTVTSMQQPIGGLTVAVIKNDILIGEGITDGTGVAQVQLDSLITQPGPGQLIISGYNCKPTAYTVQFTGNVAVAEINGTDFQVYPNPAVEDIQINFMQGHQYSAVLLKDLTGKTLAEYTVTGIKTLAIPVSAMEPGIYFLQMAGKESCVMQKIIIR